MAVLYSALFISVAFIPYQFFSFAHYGVTVKDILLPLFFIVMAKRTLWDGQPLRYTLNLPLLCVLCLPPVLFFSSFGLFSQESTSVQYIRTSVHFYYYWCFGLLFAGLHLKAQDIILIFRIILIWGIFLALFGIYQIFARAFDLPFAWIATNNISLEARGISESLSTRQLSLSFSNFYRATSIFSEPGVLGAHMVIMLTLIGIPYVQRRKMVFSSRLLNWSMALLFSVTLFLTFSLSGLFSLFMIVLLVILQEKWRHVSRLLVGVFVIIIVSLVVDAIIEPYVKISVVGLFGKRVGGIVNLENNHYKEYTQGESYAERVGGMSLSTVVWDSYPVTGISLGGFAYSRHARRQGVLFPTSTYFSLLAETGIPGILVIAAMFISLIYSLYTLCYRKNSFSKELSTLLGILPYLVVVMAVVQMTSNGLVSVSFWLNIGLYLAVIAIAKQEQHKPLLYFSIVQTPLRVRFAHAVSQLRGHPHPSNSLP